jgi:N-acetylneuraminic acid mutarotase
VALLGGACGGGDDGDSAGATSAATAADAASQGMTSAPTGGGDADTTAGSGPAGPTDGAWSTLRPIALGVRQGCGVAALDGEVYVLGGFSDAGLVPRVEAYTPTSDTWRMVANFPNSTVHHPNLVAAAGQLWVVGFLSALTFDAVGQTWSYDPATDVWSERAPLPAGTERGAAATAVIDGLIYVVGGERMDAAVADAWAYDPGADTWSPLPPLPTARDQPVAGAIAGLLYVVGGRGTEVSSHVPDVDIYDPQTGAWTAGPPMPTSRAGSMAAVVGDWLFVGGGEGNAADPDGIFPQWEVLDTTTQTWSSLPDMLTPRHGSGAAAVGDVIYVPGGAGVAAFGAVDVHEAWTVG